MVHLHLIIHPRQPVHITYLIINFCFTYIIPQRLPCASYLNHFSITTSFSKDKPWSRKILSFLKNQILCSDLNFAGGRVVTLFNAFIVGVELNPILFCIYVCVRERYSYRSWLHFVHQMEQNFWFT